MIARREANGNDEGYLPKRRKEKDHDGNSSEYSMILTGYRERHMRVEHALGAIHQAALDSGCMSHTVMQSSLPVDAVIESGNCLIKTARNDVTMHSFGQSSNGILDRALVLGDDELEQNLVSIPQLDLMGFTITFGGGVGVVSDANGNIITRTPLSKNNMYEFDIRHMFGSQPYNQSAMLGSAKMSDNFAWTW